MDPGRTHPRAGASHLQLRNSNFGGPPWRRGGGCARASPRTPPPPPPRVTLGFVIVELNRAALDRMLGELAQRYFAGPDGFIYNVLVVSGGAGQSRDLSFRSATHGGVPKSAGCARHSGAGHCPRRTARSRVRRRAGRRHAQKRHRRRARIVWGARTRGDPNSMRPRGPLILPSAAEAPWQLLARHKGGSLESVVAADRRRNLFLSFGVLLLLAVSMAMIIVSAQRARRLARLQMEFVAGVSHELRTPVAVICSAADNLAEGFVGAKDQVKEYGAVIRNEGRRLAGMIEQILRFSAGQSRRRLTNWEPVAVPRCGRPRACEHFGAAGSRRLHRGARHRPGSARRAGGRRGADPLPGEPDLERAEIWRHSALGAGPRDPTDGTRVRIRVEDRGEGIDPADLPHIFEPFYRGKAAASRADPRGRAGAEPGARYCGGHGRPAGGIQRSRAGKHVHAGTGRRRQFPTRKLCRAAHSHGLTCSGESCWLKTNRD